ncbi:hypothetical protein [Arthrobacter sp. NyZ413]|uniref:hypothetical protein n=1 Tax=Arthrobacter sp. NyZ413 TaxID=3144669 RepID=UPI002CC17133|nr:hypothetical protein [Arthrobacter sp.]
MAAIIGMLDVFLGERSVVMGAVLISAAGLGKAAAASDTSVTKVNSDPVVIDGTADTGDTNVINANLSYFLIPHKKSRFGTNGGSKSDGTANRLGGKCKPVAILFRE